MFKHTITNTNNIICRIFLGTASNVGLRNGCWIKPILNGFSVFKITSASFNNHVSLLVGNGRLYKRAICCKMPYGTTKDVCAI